MAEDLRHARTSIFVRNLVLPARVGVYQAEHDRVQTLVFDVEVGITRSSTDELEGTVDYAVIPALIRAVLAAGHITLIETIAQRVAEGIGLMTRVESVKVRVTKPAALADTEQVGVVVEYARLADALV